MKKLFFAALAMVAVLFASCEKIEPTAVNPDSMNSAAVITGFVQYHYATKSQPSVIEEVANKEITLLRKVGDAYIPYSVKTDSKGFYQYSLPVAAGQSAKVKVQATCKGTTYYMNQEGKAVTGDAIFCAESAETTVSAGQTTNINLMLVPVSYLEEPGK